MIGIAVKIHDLPVPATIDVSITSARDEENLDRLAEDFDELKAGLLTADDTGTWFPRHPVENWAQYDTLHLVTQHGLLDVVCTPDGATRGFDDFDPSPTNCYEIRQYSSLLNRRPQRAVMSSTSCDVTSAGRDAVSK